MTAQNFTDLPPAIVCNCHYNGLAIIQELGHRGITCIAADCRREIGTFSRYAKYVNVPSPVTDENGFIEGIIDICRSLKQKPVIIPTNDEWAMALGRHRDRLQNIAMPVVSEPDALDLVLDKRAFYRIGAERKYRTPYVYDLQHITNNNTTIFPVAIKPDIHRFSGTWRGRQTALPEQLRFNVIQTQQELEPFIKRWHEFRNHLLITEYIPGMGDRMITVGVYADFNHNVSNVFTGRKIRGYPVESGDCVTGKSEAVPQELITLSERITSELKLTGILQFEFKQHGETGEYYLLEVNPRSWSWAGITPHCGVNLPLTAYQDITGCSFPENSDTQVNNIYYSKITEDLINCTLRYKKEYPPWSMSVTQFRRFLKTHKVISVEFRYSDYLISMVAIYKMLRNFFFAMVGK